MKNIDINNTLEELKNLKPKQKIFIRIDKDLSNMLKLYDIKSNSYENLFTSYINNTCEEANTFNLDKFLDKYTEAFMMKDEIINKILKDSLKEDGYEYFRLNNFNYVIDYRIDALMIEVRE